MCLLNRWWENDSRLTEGSIAVSRIIHHAGARPFERTVCSCFKLSSTYPGP